MRCLSVVGVAALLTLPGLVMAQTSPETAPASSAVVGPTGPMDVPDPKPRAQPQASATSSANSDGAQRSGRGSHGGHHGHGGNGSGGQTQGSNPSSADSPNG